MKPALHYFQWNEGWKVLEQVVPSAAGKPGVFAFGHVDTWRGPRLLVCGGRNYHDAEAVNRALDSIKPSIVIHGGALGADRLAHDWATRHNIPTFIFPADWAAHGRAAGPMRNERMIYDGHPTSVVAFPGGAGTADMVRRARAAGLNVRMPAGVITTDEKDEAPHGN